MKQVGTPRQLLPSPNLSRSGKQQLASVTPLVSPTPKNQQLEDDRRIILKRCSAL
jgi:hypothetical protein